MGENLNIRTIAALLLFIPVALLVVRRQRPALATAGLLVFGVLFLPMLAGFKLPGLPFFGKQHIAATWTFIALLIFRRDRVLRPRLGFAPWCLITVSAVASLATSLTNADAQTFGPTYVQAVGIYDTVHVVLDDLMTLWLPFIMGAAMFRTYEDLRTLLRVVAVGALFYTLPAFIELRLSPQMHNWLYGFSQHDFSQTMRDGGYRPMVFMSHGLSLALFTCAAMLSAAALYRARERIGRFKAWIPAAGLFGLLVLLKSLGSLVFGTICAPLALFAKPRTQQIVAIILVAIFFSYPIARSSGTIPDEELVAFIQDNFGEDRAGSLDFRMQNERALIKRANERLLFGWGGFCRGCVFDPFYGDLLSVRDGGWIIALGDRGVIGMGTQFGLLGYAILLAFRRRRSIKNRRAQFLYATLTLITGLYIFDCVPNGLYNYLPYLFAGALIGAGRGLVEASKRELRHKRRKARQMKRLSSNPPAPAPA